MVLRHTAPLNAFAWLLLAKWHDPLPSVWAVKGYLAAYCAVLLRTTAAEKHSAAEGGGLTHSKWTGGVWVHAEALGRGAAPFGANTGKPQHPAAQALITVTAFG